MYTFLDHYDNEYGSIATIEVTNAVNGEKSIKGEIYSNDNVLHNIDKGWRLRFQDEYFVITYAKPKDVGNKVQVSFDAVHQFFWDFSKLPANEQLADGSHTFQAYLGFIFKDTGYRYSLEQNAKAFEKQSFGYKSKLALFNDVVSTAGVEFQVNGKVVRILEKTGTDLSTVVRKNFNMNDLTIEKNIDGFITYQKGFGAWNDKDDHSKGRLEVEYESPLAKEFGRLGGEPVVDERYTDSQSLLSVLRSNVENSYTISVQIDMEDLTRAGYRYDQPVAGDYIMAINETLGLQEKIRIVSYTSQYDAKGTLISHKVTCNDIGSVKKQSSSYARLSKSVNESNQQIQDALIKANNALVTADGKNTSYFGTEFPEDVPKGTLTKGDIFYRTVGDRTLMYFWNGSDWEDNPVINDTEEFKRTIDQQFEDFNTSYDEAKALQDQQIADVLAKAGANKSLAEEAKRVGDQAKLDAANALSSVQTVKDEAIAEARRLDTIVRKDTETKLATAKSQAIEEAQRLVDGTKGELAQRLSSAETEITKTNDEIKTLAKKSELDTVNNRLSSTESSVNQMSDKIETEISRIEGKIPNEIGGRNLLLNSDFSKSTKGYSFTVDGQIYDTTAVNWNTYNGGIANATTSYHAYVADFEGRKNAIIYNESDGSRNWKGILQVLGDRMPQTTNNFILSADVFVTGAGTKLFGGFHYFDKSGKPNFHSGYFRFDTSSFEIGKWQRVNVTVPFEKEKADFSKSVRFYIYAYNFGTNAILAIDNVKLETGKIATGHILATEDLTEDIETVKTTITKTAEGVKQLSTKAIETDSKISNSETKINQLIGEVSTKVAQRDYDSLLGRVSSAETTIRTQAGQIEQRLTSTQVNQLIDTKGFATTSTVQNIVQNTADSFTQTISRVEGKIPTEIGGRNLWIKKDSYGYSAVESLPSNHITGQSECYRLENGVALIFNIEPNFSSRLYGKVTFTAWVKYENVVQGANAWNVFNCFKHVLYRKNSKTGVTSTADYTALKSFTGTSDWQKITVTYDYGQNTNYDQLKTQLRFYVERATSGTAWVTGIKVELGSIATDYSLAIEDNITIASFNEVKDTVDTHTRTIGDMQGNISAIAMTASGLIGRVTNAESGLGTVQSQLAGSWAVKNLTSSGAVLNQINLLANGTNRIDGRLTHITGSTLIDNGVIKSAMIGDAQINTAHIGTIDARQANIININASNITSGTITGINMRGGVLSAINGNTVFDLNNAKLSFNSDAKIEFYNNNNAFRRVVSGYGNQFIKFKTGGFTRDGATGWNANKTVIGSNRGGSESDENGEFAGLRIWNMKLPSQNKSADQIDIIGDTVAIMDSATGGSRSPWIFYNHNGTNQLAFVGNAENSKQHFIGTTDRPFEQIHGKTIVASRDMFLQGERVAKMIKDLALKIGYKGNDGWANRIG